jgi:hypothetical protein
MRRWIPIVRVGDGDRPMGLWEVPFLPLVILAVGLSVVVAIGLSIPARAVYPAYFHVLPNDNDRDRELARRCYRFTS